MSGLGQFEVKLPGNYSQVSKIGSGGMGSVYRAYDAAMARVVAIKVIRSGAFGEVELKRFRGEAKALAKLDHPNVIKVHSIGYLEEGGAPYMVLEYVKGPSLDKVLKDTCRLPENELWKLLTDVAHALEHAHKNGIVHRDIKPGNILVAEQYKVVDFGIARLSNTGITQDLTKSGVIVGSPAYVSPEQCMSGNVDARSDLYSLGCVMFQAATGRLPFEGDNPLDVLSQHCMNDAPSITAVCPEVTISERLQGIIQRCLMKSPEDRFQNAEELLEAIEQRDVAMTAPVKLSGTNRRIQKKRSLVQTLCVLVPAFSLVIAGGGFVIRELGSSWSQPQSDAPQAVPEPLIVSPERLLSLAIQLRDSGKPEEAQPLFEKALAGQRHKAKDVYENLFQIAHNELMIGRYKDACAHFQDALDLLDALHPGLTNIDRHIACYLGQANACDSLGDADGIDAYLRKTHNKGGNYLTDESDYDIEIMTGHAQLIRKNYQAAEKIYVDLIKRMEQDGTADESRAGNAYCDLGRSLMYQNKLPEARKAFFRSRDIHAKHNEQQAVNTVMHYWMPQVEDREKLLKAAHK